MKKVIGLSLILVNLTWADGDFEFRKIAKMESCDQFEQRRLLADERKFEERLSELKSAFEHWTFKAVRESYLIPNDREFIEGDQRVVRYEAYRRSMLRVFAKMSTDVGVGLSLKCVVSPNDRFCRGGDVKAYVPYRFGQVIKKIHLCELYFGGKSDVTLFHELSHYAADTFDYAGDWWTRERIDLQRASQDAYHIADFLEGDIERNLKFRIWAFLWRKK